MIAVSYLMKKNFFEIISNTKIFHINLFNEVAYDQDFVKFTGGLDKGELDKGELDNVEYGSAISFYFLLSWLYRVYERIIQRAGNHLQNGNHRLSGRPRHKGDDRWVSSRIPAGRMEHHFQRQQSLADCHYYCCIFLTQPWTSILLKSVHDLTSYIGCVLSDWQVFY